MIVGITGGVGAGKSTVLSILERDCRARLLIADEMGHEVMEPGSDACREICRLFPEVSRNGVIDRNRLAEIVYAHPEKMKQLNAVIHPRVLQKIREKLEEWREEPLIVIETAILFETGCDALCDQIWGVTADREVRIRRLMDSRGYTRERALAIMSQQLSQEEMSGKCHFLIKNNGNLEELSKQIKYLLGIQEIL